MSKLTKFENAVFNDTAVIALVATPTAWVASGGGVLVGLLMVIPVIVPAFFITGIATMLVGKPPSVGRMLLVWLPSSALAYALITDLGTGRMFAAILAAVIFLYGYGRSVVALEKLHDAGQDPESPHEVAESPDAPAAVPLPAAAPEELPAELKTIVAAAQQDFRHLCDALADPSLAGAAGVDVAGTRGEAEQLLRDILRRAPLVARVRRIAGERPDDEPARKTSDDALAALRRQADALRGATSAALQVAATAGHDPTLLREHTDNLQLLREIRDDERAGA
jgi:hypothetical protein